MTAPFIEVVRDSGLFPATTSAAADNIRLNNFGYSGVSYESAALKQTSLNQIYFQNGSQTTVDLCAAKGGGKGPAVLTCWETAGRAYFYPFE